MNVWHARVTYARICIDTNTLQKIFRCFTPRKRLVQTFPHAQNDQWIRAHLLANKSYFVVRLFTLWSRLVWSYLDMQNDQWIRAHLFIRILVFTYSRYCILYIYIFIYLYIYMFICLYIYICVHINIYIYIYIPIKPPVGW